MDWKDLGVKLTQFAPVIGTAIGGPAGGAVGALIAQALGVDETPEAVSKELRHNPDAFVKIKALESNERIKFQEYANETLKAELNDLRNARETHKHSRMPAVICVALTFIVAGGAYMLFTAQIPDNNIDMAYILFGGLMAKWGDSIAYWVGTTRSSANKTIIANAAK